MKPYILMSDIHKFGVDPVNKSFVYVSNAVDMGDNVEGKNIPEDMIEIVKKFFHAHRKKILNVGGKQVRDNHSVELGKSVPVFEYEDGVLFTHGHRIFMKVKRWLGWEKRKMGQNSFFRCFSKYLSKARHVFKKKKLSKKEIDKVLKYVQVVSVEENIEIHTIAMGHLHPTILIDITVYNKYLGSYIRIVVAPRGITHINL